MNLLAYYISHSFINQIKKIFRTWVVIFFLICVLVGGGVGLLVGTLQKQAKEKEEAAQTEEVQTEEEAPGFHLTLPEGVNKIDAVETVAGALIIALLAFCAVNADTHGSKLFLPADVTLLFPSPMRPQSVLLFRLACNLGLFLLLPIFYLGYVPLLTMKFGLGIPQVIFVFAAMVIVFMFSQLIQTYLYCYAASVPGRKKYIRIGVYSILALLVVSCFVYSMLNGGNIAAAVRFMNHRASRFVPVYGWIKGMVMYSIEGNYLAAIICTLLSAVTMTGLIYAIYKMRPDFYEDAMKRSEETAELMEQVQSGRSAVTVKKKADRSERLVRDNMKYGSGASVFFFRTMYNRKRFATLGFITKTTWTYLIVTLLAYFMREPDKIPDSVLIFLALAAITFYRNLGNPLEADLKTHYFLVTPEMAWKKVMFSELGGIANSLLDMIPALILTVVLTKPSIWLLGAAVVFILSLAFYSMNTGAFIYCSVPESIGKTVKQLLLVLFVYFGLLPDGVVIALSFFEGSKITLSNSLLISSGINIFLGTLFMALVPLFIDPPAQNRDPDTRALKPEETAAAKKCFLICGIAAAVQLALGSALQLLVAYPLIEKLGLDKGGYSSWASWVATFLPIYAVGFPVAILILKKVPVAAKKTAGEPVTLKGTLSTIAVSGFLLISGNLISLLVNGLISLIPAMEGKNQNVIATLASEGDLLPKIVFMVILAPVFEELFYRKCLIDRMRRYGEKLAVFTTALMFGLFHGNLSQFFYAFFLGLLLGYIYLKTNKMRYTVILHMLINFYGSVLLPGLASLAGDGTDQKALRYLLIVEIIMFIVAIIGMVILIIRCNSLRFETAECGLVKKERFKTVWCNAGMILFLIATIALFAFSLMAG